MPAKINIRLCQRKITNWVFRMRFRTFFFLIGGILLFYFIVVILKQIRKEMTNDAPEFEMPIKWTGNFEVVTDPVILWWTPFTGIHGDTRRCGDFKCFITQDTRFRNHSHIKMFLFYGTNFNPFNLPLPRNGLNVDWALLHEESPKNTPILLHSESLELFNYTSTFSRKSHFPLTLQYLKDLDVLTDTKYYVNTEMKDTLLSKLAPVVYIHSDCATPLDRDIYATELMKYIPVDSYGKCANNKALPNSMSDPLKHMDSDEFLHFVSRYKFTLTFENSVCEDYITEKLWRPLVVGSVPIYMGSPSVQDWLPNHSNSAILADNFKSPKELAAYLISLNKDPIRYESYLKHKLSKTIDNKLLVSTMQSRQWGIDNDYAKGNFIEHYECFLCEQLHKREATFRSIANVAHYNCESPVSPITRLPDPTNWWVNQWKSSKCEAKVLHQFVNKRKNINTHDEFLSVLKKYIATNMC